MDALNLKNKFSNLTDFIIIESEHEDVFDGNKQNRSVVFAQNDKSKAQIITNHRRTADYLKWFDEAWRELKNESDKKRALSDDNYYRGIPIGSDKLHVVDKNFIKHLKSIENI